MSVKTSVSSTAQSLSTRPGILSGPGALRLLILLRDLLTLSVDSVITWSPGGGGVFCAVVLFCASKRAKAAFSSFSRGMVLSQVCGGGFVVRNGLNPLPQAPSVSAVAETMGYPPGVLSLGLSDVAGQVGPSCLQALLISSSKGSVPSLQKSVDLPCQPRLLVGPDSDRLCDHYIINTLGDVGSDSLWVLLEVCSIVVCGSLLKHVPVSSVKTVLKCLWRPFRPHLYLFVYWFDGFNERSVCRH